MSSIENYRDDIVNLIHEVDLVMPEESMGAKVAWCAQHGCKYVGMAPESIESYVSLVWMELFDKKEAVMAVTAVEEPIALPMPTIPEEKEEPIDAEIAEDDFIQIPLDTEVPDADPKQEFTVENVETPVLAPLESVQELPESAAGVSDVLEVPEVPKVPEAANFVEPKKPRKSLKKK